MARAGLGGAPRREPPRALLQSARAGRGDRPAAGHGRDRAARPAGGRDHARRAALPGSADRAGPAELRTPARQPHRFLPRAGRGAAPAHPGLPLAAARSRRRRHPEDRRRGRGRGPAGRDPAARDRGWRVRPQPRARPARPRPARLPGATGGSSRGRHRRSRVLWPGTAEDGGRPRAPGRDGDRRGRPPGRRGRPGGAAGRREDEPRLPRSDPPRGEAARAALPHGAVGPRRPREARLPLRPRLRRGRALGRAPLDRRLAAADRGPHGGDRRRLHGRRGPPFRGLALVRRHGRAGDARSRRERLRGRGPARHRRAAGRDATSRPHPWPRARGRRRRAPPHDLRLGRDAPGNRRHRRCGRELAPGKDAAAEREDRRGPRRAGGRASPALRAPRLARRRRAADLRASGDAWVGAERPRQRRSRRGGSRSPRGRGSHGGPRRGRGRVHPGPTGAGQPGSPSRGPHRRRHVPRPLARHGGLADLRGPLRRRERRLRPGELGPRRVDGHSRYRRGGDRVAAARAPERRGRAPLGRAS